ncbi:hypothetical protein V6N11_056000 [Hibiscus sabdariffa]|uniref:Uncharacterized protein n=1 Tax=Hibiscus sabdariffa TaxID=183260 RepID=A0ABR2T2S4_9ROSI
MEDMQTGESGMGIQDIILSWANEAGSTKPKVTYANMVVGIARESDSRDNDHGIQSDEIVVLEDDYVIGQDGPYPSIKFSEKPSKDSVNTCISIIDANATTDSLNKAEDLYGPWMVVDNRRRRQGLATRNSTNRLTKGKAISGSRFAPLELDESEDNLLSAIAEIGDVEMIRDVAIAEDVRASKNVLLLDPRAQAQNISNQMTSILARAMGGLKGVTKASVSESGLLESIGSSIKHLGTHEDERIGEIGQLDTQVDSEH